MLKAFAVVPLGAAALLGLAALAPDASAASAIGGATQRVIRALSLVRESDLDFGTATNGDPARTVPPTTHDTPENASFAVSGEPSACYAILLPGDADVTLTTADGATPDRRIGVYAFRSFPEGQGTLGPNGRQSLYVGATRAPIRETQASGLYKGVFTVTVVY